MFCNTFCITFQYESISIENIVIVCEILATKYRNYYFFKNTTFDALEAPHFYNFDHKSYPNSSSRLQVFEYTVIDGKYVSIVYGNNEKHNNNNNIFTIYLQFPFSVILFLSVFLYSSSCFMGRWEKKRIDVYFVMSNNFHHVYYLYRNFPFSFWIVGQIFSVLIELL